MNNLCAKNGVNGKRKTGRIYQRAFPYLLIAPVAIYLLTMLLGPLLYGVWMSFTNKAVGLPSRFVGLSNYVKLWSNGEFLIAAKNTFLYTLLTVGLKVILGMVMALVLNAPLRFKNISRGLMFIPWALPTVVTVIVWKWMFSDVGGVLNAIFMNLGIVDTKIAWLSTPLMAFTSVVAVNVWRGTPFIGMSVLSGLQSVPTDMYEAAKIDGVNPWQELRYITLPSIKDVLMLSTLVTTIWTFSDFEIIWLLTKGGPINATQVISTLSYTIGIQRMSTGQAMAASIMFMPVMILLVNLVTAKTLGKKGEAA
ncbi:MAG: sugar ABC transporter permease [Clostridia bacterium]